VALGIFDFKRDLGLKLVFFSCLEGDLDDLLLTRPQSTTGMRYLELFREPIDSRELPVCWNRADIFQRKGLGELLAKQKAIECDHVLVDLDDGLCSEGLDVEDGRIWIVLEQADDLVLEEPRLVWECKHGEVFGLIDLKLHELGLQDEW